MARLLIVFFIGLKTIAALEPDRQFLPKGNNYQRIDHTYYSLGYDEGSEQAAWVAYELSKEELTKNVSRNDRFQSDEAIETISAQLNDYRHSGYDRGHLAPAADMSFSQQAMDESFYMSNISPQDPSFNRGLWRRLEALFRAWVWEYGKLYIVTAGILQGEKTIGSNEVLVPLSYYKIAYNSSKETMIGFILAQNKADSSLASFAVSVDQIEGATGLDFFSQLEDTKEERLESQVVFADWNFRASSPPPSPVNSRGALVQAEPGIEAGTTDLVKKSKSGICHDSKSIYYLRTKNYQEFSDLQSCLASGGRLPKS